MEKGEKIWRQAKRHRERTPRNQQKWTTWRKNARDVSAEVDVVNESTSRQGT